MFLLMASRLFLKLEVMLKFKDYNYSCLIFRRWNRLICDIEFNMTTWQNLI